MKSMKKYELNYSKLKIGVNVLKRDVIVYKKLDGAIAQLLLPAGTKIMKSAHPGTAKYTNKLRADKAITLMIIPCYHFQYASLDKKQYKSIDYGNIKGSTYRLGKQITPNGFDTDINKSCGKGIHFFCELNRAENY